MRSNYLACSANRVGLPDVIDNGWLASGEINWIDEAFPDETEHILCDGSDQEDINKEYEESTSSEEKVYGSEMFFYFDETLILYF